MSNPDDKGSDQTSADGSYLGIFVLFVGVLVVGIVGAFVGVFVDSAVTDAAFTGANAGFIAGFFGAPAVVVGIGLGITGRHGGIPIVLAGFFVGAIVGPIMAVGAPIPIFFIGVYGIAVRTRTFLWSIGVYESGATVSYPQATKPKDPTPSDLLFLELAPSSNRESHGVVRVHVDGPPTPPSWPESSHKIVKLMATAILANEEAGTLRLEMVNEEAPKVVAAAGSTTPNWPGSSLESQLRQYGAVSDSIYAWIGEQRTWPKTDAIERIMASMMDRRLLEVDKKKV